MVQGNPILVKKRIYGFVSLHEATIGTPTLQRRIWWTVTPLRGVSSGTAYPQKARHHATSDALRHFDLKLFLLTACGGEVQRVERDDNASRGFADEIVHITNSFAKAVGKT
jgi:hypothetical protein